MKNKKMNILITGSSGFIGYHLSKKLLSSGYKVIGLDGFTDYYDVNLKKKRNDILINDPLCEQVVTLTRNELIINNTKHKNHVIDFSSLNEIKKTIKICDYVYSAIGTTQSRVNYNKKLYRSIDYDIT